MAGPNDFTGQNIQDTYQRVLQVSNSKHIVDGTGSLVTDLTIEGTGSLGRIEVLHISSSTGDFDANTIRIGGTPFNKSDLIAINFVIYSWLSWNSFKLKPKCILYGLDIHLNNIKKLECIK